MVEISDFSTKEQNTWCPGCLNNVILNSIKKAFTNLVNNGTIKKENIVITTGIGCAAKIFDYINVNALYSIHGRTIPTSLGIKIANPELTVVAFGGDGDVYAEGIGHLIHGARKNIDMTMIVHDNQIFALTTGQVTPTTEPGYSTKSTPFGAYDRPMNPILLALSSGATFVARGTTLNPDHLAIIIEEAIKHKGFSFVEVLQPCLAFHNSIKDLQGKTYVLDNNNLSDFNNALKIAQEWDYTKYEDARIPIGIFYKTEKKILEEKLIARGPFYNIKRDINIDELLNKFK